jgi:hypothetical protein
MSNTLDLAPRGERRRRPATGRRVGWRCSSWRRGLFATLGQTVRDLALLGERL